MDLQTLQIIVDIVLSILAAVGGGVGIYFWKVNKSLKEAEVKEKEASVTDQQQQTWSKQNEEYQEYIRLLKEDKEELKHDKAAAEEKEREARMAMEDMRTTLNDVVKRVGILEVQVERAESFRCERLGCMQRIPPLKGTIAKVTAEANTEALDK